MDDKKKRNDQTFNIVDVIRAEIKTSQSLGRVLKTYIKNVVNIIDIIGNVNDSGIEKLTRVIEAKKDKDGIIKVEGKADELVILKAVDAVSKLVGSISKSFETIAKMDVGFKAFLQFKKKMLYIPDMLRLLLTELTDALLVIADDKNTRELLYTLVGRPEMTKKKFKGMHKTGVDEYGKDVLESMYDETTVGKDDGLLTVFISVIDILKAVSELKMPNFVSLYMKVKIMSWQLRIVLNTMLNTFVEISKNVEIKDLNKFVTSLNEILDTYGDIIDNINSFMKKVVGASILSRLVLRKGGAMGFVKKFFISIIDLLNDPKVSQLYINNQIENYIDIISDNIDNFKELIDKILNIVGEGALRSFIKLNIILQSISKTLSLLSSIYEYIVNFANKKNNDDAIKTASNIIAKLEDIFVNLNKLAIAIIGFAVIAVPATIAAFLSIGFIWALMWCLKGIILVLELFPDKAIRNMNKDILKLAIIFYSLIAVEMALIAIATITAKYWDIMLFGLIGVTVLLGISIGALWLISLATKNGIDIKTMLALLLFTAILGALTVVMLLLVGISFIVQYIEWSALGKALLLFVAVLGILIVIGTILSVSAVVLLPLAGVVGATVAIVAGILIGILSIFSIILGAQKMILEIQNININKKLLIQKIEDLFSIVFEVTGSILDNRLGKFGDGTFIKLKRAKRLLNKINKVFDKLVGVSKSLTELSKITIPNDVSSKIQLLFNTIFGGNDKSFAIVPTISEMDELVEKRKTTRKAKRLLKQVCGVTEQLANITKSLNDIANFNIEESTIQSGLTKIFNTIDFVQQQIDEKLIKVDENTTERAKRRALRQNKKKMRQTAKALGKADEVLLEIESIVDGFNKIKDFKLENSAIETAISGIFTNIDSFIQIVDKNTIGGGTDMSSGSFENKMDALERVSSIIKGFTPENDEVNRHKNFIENNIKFLDKINSADISKIQTTSNLFEHMAKMSESINGNFDGLADTLNEKIAPLIEELKEMMDELPKKIDEATSKISASTFAASNPNLSESEMRSQVTREGVDPTKQAYIIQQRMVDQLKRQNNDVTSKLDELIDIFRNGIAQVKMA